MWPARGPIHLGNLSIDVADAVLFVLMMIKIAHARLIEQRHAPVATHVVIVAAITGTYCIMDRSHCLQHNVAREEVDCVRSIALLVGRTTPPVRAAAASNAL